MINLLSKTDDLIKIILTKCPPHLKVLNCCSAARHGPLAEDRMRRECVCSCVFVAAVGFYSR